MMDYASTRTQDRCEKTSRLRPKITIETIDQKFARLADKWKKESAHLSSIERMAQLPSYQAIISMGAEVVPLLLKELQKEPDHWFWALHTITQEDPANGQGTMRIADLTALWIEWGRQKGLL